MTRRRLVVITVLIIFIQTTMLAFFRIGGLIIQLSLLWSIFLATRAERLEAILLSFFMGLGFDLMFSTTFGIHSISYMLLSYWMSMDRIKDLENTWYNNGLVIVMGSLLYHAFMGLVIFFLGIDMDIRYVIKRLYSYEIIESLLVGIPFYLWMDKYRIKSKYRYRM